MSMAKQRGLATGLKWLARVFGLAGVVFYLGLLLAGILDNQYWVKVGSQISFANGIALTVGGLIVSWWKTRLAGVLLILSFVGPLGMFIYSTTRKDIVYSISILIFSLPSLIAGGLFLLSWWLSRKVSPSEWIQVIQLPELNLGWTE